MKARRAAVALGLALGGALALLIAARPPAVDHAPDRPGGGWTPAERALLRSITLATLPPSPPDPSNAFTGDDNAIAFGRQLFGDTRLGRSGNDRACASCHQPARRHTDGRARPEGSPPGTRHTPALAGAALGRWFNWDGSADSLWAQALGPMESAAEMGASRGEIVARLGADVRMRADYERVFGPWPVDTLRTPRPCGPRGDEAAQRCWRALDPAAQRGTTQVFVALGKALAAYVTTMQPAATRVDRFAAALDEDPVAADGLLSQAEQRGLRLFLDLPRTRCLNCHNGPLLSNGGFHAIGTGGADPGRLLGLQRLARSEFRCDGPHSDALPDQCTALRSAENAGEGGGLGAFKVPTLRQIAHTAPYGHDGRFATLREVLAHYRRPPGGAAGSHELQPLDLGDAEMEDLLAFLLALGE